MPASLDLDCLTRPEASALQDNQQDKRQLFFSRISKTATEDDVLAAFNAYGDVLDVVIFQTSQGSGLHKGCGLVTMRSHAEAAAAIAGLHRLMLWPGCSKAMAVDWMNDAMQQNHAAGKGTTDTPPAGCDDDAIKLFVGNLPLSCTAQQLLPIFQAIGHVVELGLIYDKVNGSKPKGCAFVWFKEHRDAERAIAALNLQHVLPDQTGQQHRPLVVRTARYGACPPTADARDTSPARKALLLAQAASRTAMARLLANSTPLQRSAIQRPQSMPVLLNSPTPPLPAYMHAQRPTVISAPVLTTTTAPPLQYVSGGSQMLHPPDWPYPTSQLQQSGRTALPQLVQLQPSQSHNLQQVVLPSAYSQVPASQYVWMVHSQPRAAPPPQYMVVNMRPAQL